MEAAALRAAQLDPNLGGVHESLAGVSFLYKWNWASTEREIKLSLALDPNGAETHLLYSMYLRTMHRFDEALREAKRAQELDPLSSEQKSMVALVHYYARHYDAAEEQYRHTRRKAAPSPSKLHGLPSSTTSIRGSSCLYSSSLATLPAGVL